MDEQQHQIIERIHQAQNILVTVSANPSVDQLAAAIGLTIALNKLDKHGTAVFSGKVPSTLEFLKPADTLEKNTDSLRDFIIALDKGKADKLRYKVEDEVVRIFITPYKTSLSQKDLQFSQGDFNVDVVVCLGVTEQQDLDTAITAHGRILHDATVVSISTQGQGSLGSINWVDPTASSLSEMALSLVDGLDKKAVDGQIATALLTGIVATTDRFRNEKTSPKTMSASAELMAAGANQQLIATELEAPATESSSGTASESSEQADNPAESSDEPPAEPGTLEIDHEGHDDEAEEPAEPPEPEPQVRVDENGQLITEGEEPLPEISQVRGVDVDGRPAEAGNTEVKRERLSEPPRLGTADLTANSRPEEYDLPTEELTLPAIDEPLLSHTDTPKGSAPAAPTPPPAPFTPPPVQPPVGTPPAVDPFAPDTTLSEIEQSVDSPHLKASEPASETSSAPSGTVDDARSAVEAALNSAPAPLAGAQPIAALNAQPLGPDLRAEQANEAPASPAPFVPPAPTAPSPLPVTNTGFNEPTPGNSPADQTLDMPLPSNPFGAGQPAAPFMPPAMPQAPAPQTPPSAFPGLPQQPGQTSGGQTPPPPVPPPMLPPLQ